MLTISLSSNQLKSFFQIPMSDKMLTDERKIHAVIKKLPTYEMLQKIFFVPKFWTDNEACSWSVSTLSKRSFTECLDTIRTPQLVLNIIMMIQNHLRVIA